MRKTLLASVAIASLVLAACGDDDEDDATTAAATETATDTATEATSAPATEPGTTTPAETGAAAGGPAAECAEGKTLTDGVLTIATGEPAFPPYVIDDDPASGQGFESAVALAVARELGFSGDAVTWVRTGFDAAIAPGPKDFDFNLQQYGITPERAEVVDFSRGYYSAPQAVFGLADSPAASATTIADLKGLKIGVAAGTTSITYVEEVIAPESDPLIFNDNAAAKAALESDQIDAIVSDLPTALFITAVEIEGTTVYGQIEGSGTDEWGLLLAKDSPLTECVNMALDTLEESGELEAITTEWMSEYTEAPMITA
jgi:polar amino acid transport system substrate-binding protein